ncbi:Bifunctional glycosyl transferase/transpeptidase [Sodalis praecaptivus]|uniref:Penicillin-binding protein 1B n=1 Tax=Sodalis praecaptivus TaxID=1239307 RepID=W0HR70_9GAMM|nr:penicillin-binding protein 1B [Sodalis praecaptivus]AHF76341.1 Bifunctional glycosyl transferase/transpeptidase [Sodalis praecaptivus]
MEELKATESIGSKRKNNNKKKQTFFKKALLVLTCLMALALIYLFDLAKDIDNKINEKMRYGFWDLPAQVYGKSYTFTVGDKLSQEKLTRILQGARYRNTRALHSPGDFSVEGNQVYIYLRQFSYPNAISEEKKVEMTFAAGTITQIVDVELNSTLDEMTIEPRLIDVIYSPSDEQRIFLSLKYFPDDMVKMLITTEDKDFHHHYGVNPLSVARAFYNNIRAGRRAQGGSTITQQVIKNMFLSHDRTIRRKLIEAFMAVILELKFSKSKILELYLNEIYLGQNGSYGIFGFPLASIHYFGRQVNELSLEQQALLIGMAKGASLYNPWSKPAVAKARRDLVLKLAKDNRVITHKDYAASIAKELNVQAKGAVFTKHPAFMKMLKEEIRHSNAIAMSDLSGAKIFSTLDPVSQEDAEQVILTMMPMLEKKTGIEDLQSAMLVVDRKKGHLLAVIGDKNVDYNGFNRASDSKRQVGSLIKPAVYLAALSHPHYFGLNTLVEDEPINVDLGQKKSWSPRNPTRTYQGSVMLMDALAHSINVATVNIGMSVGIDKVAETLRLIGIPEPRIQKNPSMLLGTLDMAPVELTEAIQTIANLGKHTGIHSLLSIQDKDGEVIYQRTENTEQVVPQQAAWLTLYAMQESVRAGTSRKLGTGFKNDDLAGKTGSSSGLRDSWFSGIDDNKVVLTWIGRDNNQTTKLWGASGSLVLTKEFLKINGVKKLQMTNPEDIYLVDVSSRGDILCNSEALAQQESASSKRQIPIWGKDMTTICHTLPQFLPVSTNKAYAHEVLDSLF